MKNLKVRLNLVLLLVGTVTVLVSGWLVREALTERAEAEIKARSLQQMAMAQAVRSYTSDHIRSLLLQDATTFRAPAIPSFAAVTTMKYLQESYPGFKYQEVAINPTNPSNKAAGWALEVVNKLRHGEDKEVFVKTGQGATAALHYARPITVAASCLACHGQASAAPRTMVAKYGSTNGFGWQVGDVIGAQIVSVPASAALAEVRSTFGYYLAGAAGVVLSLFVALNWMLSSVLVKPIQSSQETLRRQAEEDPLTGVANRRSFNERLRLEAELAMHHRGPLSALMIDLDHFKKINDTHGHGVGDAVLKEVCQRINHKIRRHDLLGRLGGEEFAVILPQTDEAGALSLASSLLKAISDEAFDQVGTVTASIGLAQWEEGEDLDAFLGRVDAGLYAAKRSGRNRAVRAKSRALA